MTSDKSVFPAGKHCCCVWFFSVIKADVKANPLPGWAKGTSKNDPDWMQSYKRQMRIFNREVILAALIALTILIVLLFIAWGPFRRACPLWIRCHLFTAQSWRNPRSSAFETPPKVSVRPYGERVATLAISSSWALAQSTTI